MERNIATLFSSLGRIFCSDDNECNTVITPVSPLLHYRYGNILSRREEILRDSTHYHRLLESKESYVRLSSTPPPRPRRPKISD